MSAETFEWLNTMQLIGFTKKRGNAWHYREEMQGEENNHYPEAIPVDDVKRRLFDFTIDEHPFYIKVPNSNGNGNHYAEVEDRKVMVTSDTHEVLGVFKAGYTGHDYTEWLINNVASIIDDDLAIGSAGLLKNRGQAYVTIEMPDSIKSPTGVEYRPNLLACTSFDGTLATTYKRVVTVIVCDNTLAAGLSEKDQTFKLKHSKYSGMKISDAREALAIVHSMAEDFESELTRLTEWEISDDDFSKLLNSVVPIPEDASNKRGVTVAEKKQAEILNLYRHDDRSAPWNGNAFGVLQAFNTWNHHFAQVRKGAPRIVRNMENVVKDAMAVSDTVVLNKLAEITA